MKPIPQDVLAQFDALLKLRNVPVASHTHYRKWLRYFLDFHAKYPLPDSKPEQVRLFIEKLRSKNQTIKQQEQAARAVSLFFSLRKVNKSIFSTVAKQTAPGASLPHSAPQATAPVSTNANNMWFANRRPCVPSRTVKEAKSPLDF